VSGFAEVARLIGGEESLLRHVEAELERLSSTVETIVHNEALIPKRSEVRAVANELKKAAAAYLSVYSKLPEVLLDLPVDRFECLSEARKALDDVTAYSDTILSMHSGKGGRPKKSAKLTCALIVVEAWTAVHCRPPGRRRERALEACECYWQACGQEPQRDEGSWQRCLIDALHDNSPLRRWLHDEFQRGTELPRI
jgi:hypothetical protein